MVIILWFIELSFFFAGRSRNCRFPGSPAHSEVFFSDESLGPGSVATYTCERGFELLGPARRTCTNGNWVPEGIPFCGKFFLHNVQKKKYFSLLICNNVSSGGNVGYFTLFFVCPTVCDDATIWSFMVFLQCRTWQISSIFSDRLRLSLRFLFFSFNLFT